MADLRNHSVPYAFAAVDNLGYHLICPKCHRKLYGDATVKAGKPFNEEEIADKIIKDAGNKYALHYLKYHQPCSCECNQGGFCGGCGHAGCGRR